jgi:copper chaperone NosL
MSNGTGQETPADCAKAFSRSDASSWCFSRMLPFVLSAVASILLLVSLRLPLWQMRLESPQYRDQEALRIAVHPDSLCGDLRELSVLQRYIGVHIPPTLPQFKWLPGLLIAGAVLGFAACLVRILVRRQALTTVSCAVAAGLALAAGQAMFQIHDIGHKRDQKTVLVGVKDFTPPFIGTNKIAQFTVTSRLGLGAWLIGGALALQLGAAWASRQPQAGTDKKKVLPAQNVARLAPVTSHSS